MNLRLNLQKNIFNEAYLPYITDYTHKYEVYYGGSGSGKSVFIAQKVLIKALKTKRKVLVIRKTAVSQKESCWRLVIELLQKWELYNLCKINLSELSIELPNGSFFLFKGLDDPERIKSIVGITDCWCEECTELNQEDFEQLTLRVRSNEPNLQFFCSFNPISKANWVYKRWFEQEPTEDTFILKTTYKDNKFLPASYIETLEGKIKTNPTYYKIYALGDFCTLDKLVYPSYTVGEPPANSNELELLIGLDWGFTNDPTALVACYKDDTKKVIYIFDEHYESGMLNTDIAQMIKYKGFAKSTIIADSAEPKSIEELKRLGIVRIKPAVKGPDSILSGIQLVNQYEIVVSDRCQNMITELQNYSWRKDKQTGEYINTPVDAFNHLCDALRYSMQTSSNRLRTLERGVL